jgi:hypothetical protein
LEGVTNVQNAGHFVPKPVIAVSERRVNHSDETMCGAPPKSPCSYFLYYPDHTTVSGNTIVQHVQHAPGVWLSNADASTITDNNITATNTIVPVGTVDPSIRATGIDLQFGVPTLPSYGTYENERTQFTGWTMSGNQLREFADGLRLRPVKAGPQVAATTLMANTVHTHVPAPRGLALEGAAEAPQVGFITALGVSKNAFGCGFTVGPTPPVGLPPQAFVRPSGQAFTGAIGVLVPCQ